MAETLTTKFLDSEASGKIKLYANSFKKAGGYFGKFERKTIGTNTLIARIQKHKAGTNELALQQSASFLKEEILEALSRGEAVNVLDLGTLYIAPKGTYDGKSIDADKNQLLVRFTPSQIAQDSIAKIGIKEIEVVSVSLVISRVTDQFSKSTEGEVSKGRTVLITGDRLKIAGEKGGVFLCPVDENEKAVTDESQWILCPVITRNTMKNLEFFVPDEAESGERYKILLRTYYSSCKNLSKNAKECFSEIVVVK